MVETLVYAISRLKIIRDRNPDRKDLSSIVYDLQFFAMCTTQMLFEIEPVLNLKALGIVKYDGIGLLLNEYSPEIRDSIDHIIYYKLSGYSQFLINNHFSTRKRIINWELLMNTTGNDNLYERRIYVLWDLYKTGIFHNKEFKQRLAKSRVNVQEWLDSYKEDKDFLTPLELSLSEDIHEEEEKRKLRGNDLFF